MSAGTPALRTERLSLEPLRVSDADELVIVLAAPGLYRFTGGAPPSLGELRRRYQLQVAGGSPDGLEAWHNWIIRTLDPVEAAGYVQATVTDGGRRADIGWVLGESWQAHGYATEATRAMIEWLLASGVEVVTAHVHPDHERSASVARRIGMRPTPLVEDGERVWRLQAARAGPRSGREGVDLGR